MNAYMKSRQSGFTLVELSVVLVIIGLLLGAVLKGQEMINTAQAKRAANDIKNMEAKIWLHADRQGGRLPGDCNRDGLIGFSLLDSGDSVLNNLGTTVGAASTRVNLLDYRTGSLVPANEVTGRGISNAEHFTAYCPPYDRATTDTTEADDWLEMEHNANVPYNDLKSINLISGQSSNRAVSKIAEGHMYIGFARIDYARGTSGSVAIADGTTAPADGRSVTDYNAIVITDVPAWMARTISIEIDGFDEPADRGRFRRLAMNGAGFETGWAYGVETNDLVNAIYFFDRIPPYHVDED